MSYPVQTDSKTRLQARLKALAEEISTELAQLESEQSKELLSDFVSELFLSAADQRQKKERRQRQAEGIAAAKAKGTRFGRTAKPLPDNFDELHQAWRDGELTLSKAATVCGMTRTTFYNAAMRKEQAAG
ncbi:MAG: hypothetical protein HFF52_09335 [Lawsonibacter sp.]|nr:hypothetical protein [Lawsonibacter sp.]